MPSFSEFNLDEKLVRSITELGYTNPTPVQDQAIPKVLEGCDLLVSAQTGTGKTAAFLLPALDKLNKAPKEKWQGPKILVLVPTRELAMQVADEAAKFSKYLSRTKTVCIYGGVPYPIQKKQLARPYELLVATPGRLIDFINQGRIDLSNIDTLVLDEADRMLDMGFLDDVEMICGRTSPDRQTLLFSATWDKRIMGISRTIQKNPYEIKVAPCAVNKKNIAQRLFFADNLGHKVRLLDHILENSEMEQAIIFTSTI
ncbi:MAG: DEAD/DEAH box helicase, partial [Chlamydiia bacterium]|nr:DEAD/DEAH box helicase [Chlamydiia bacterium]